MSDEPVLKILKEIEFSYPEDEQYVYVLPAGLELHAGEAWCIYGVSGSGKSTLMTLLASLRRLGQGTLRYRFGGHDPVEVSPESWEETAGPGLWSRIGFAFQRPELIRALTVKDNLQLVLGEISPEESLFTPGEWNRIALSKVWQVSGGQVQRLGLMRAFGHDQDLIFLDEPTNNLDRRNRSSVADFVKNKSRDRALIVVSHDDDFVHYLEIDRVFEIREQDSSGGRVRRVLTLVEETEKQMTPADGQAVA